MKKIFVILCLIMPCLCFAQSVSKIIYLNNGNSVIGEIIQDTPTTVAILSSKGDTLKFNKVSILKIVDATDYQQLPRVDKKKWIDFRTATSGFWYSAELSGGFVPHFNNTNLPAYKSSMPIQTDLTLGYRVNQFLQLGLGAGCRYYIGGNDRVYVYDNKIKEGFNISIPLFFNIRGSFIDGNLRTWVPFWSASIGYSVFDGFYTSPTIGIKFGSMPRNNFILGLSYGFQSVNKRDRENIGGYYRGGISIVALKLGYQF